MVAPFAANAAHAQTRTKAKTPPRAKVKSAPPATPAPRAAPADDAQADAATRAYAAQQAGQLEQAVTLFREALQSDPRNATLRLDLAYALLQLKRNEDALSEFQSVVRARPDDVELQRQIGYLQIELKRNDEAIVSFQNAVRLEPKNEETRLQLAYLLQEAKRRDEALAQFRVLAQSQNPKTRREAREAIGNISGSLPQGAKFTEVYSETYGQSRFSNVITSGSVRRGVILDAEKRRELYAIARFGLDSRSRGGTAPQIFADNSLTLGIGARQKLNDKGLTGFVEAGYALRLLGRPNTETGPDFRLGVFRSRAWGAGSDGAAPDRRSFGNQYYDVTYYSRYRNNVIGFLRGEQGLRLNGTSTRSPLDGYARYSLGADSGGDYYNNFGEAALGLRYQPRGLRGIALSIEAVRGIYLGRERSGERNPYSSGYNDLRVFLTYSGFWRG